MIACILYLPHIHFLRTRHTWRRTQYGWSGRRRAICVLHAACYVLRAVCVRTCLRACVPACLRACLLVCLPAYLHACLSACLSLCLHACLSLCLHACLPACLPACMPAYLSTCQPAYPSANCHVRTKHTVKRDVTEGRRHSNRNYASEHCGQRVSFPSR